MTKAVYKLRNWGEYNKSLINRGSINLWISDDLVKGWFYKRPSNIRKVKRKSGRSFIYSDKAIELCLTIRSIFKLNLRMTQGFLSSLFPKIGYSCDLVRCPNYTTMSRRGGKLKAKLKRYQNKGFATDIAIDSTGIKVYGEGEWKTRQHGVGRRRKWRKFHIGIDPISHEVLAQEVTNSNIMDDQIFPNLINQAHEKIERVLGDGAYDRISCYDICHDKNIMAIIPPQRNALLQDEMQQQVKRKDSRRLRDANIRQIRKLTKPAQNAEELLKNQEQARKIWKIEADYHSRSVVETAMFRFKQIFGDKFLSREFSNQKVEMLIKTNILNKFTKLGMPDSYPIYKQS